MKNVQRLQILWQLLWVQETSAFWLFTCCETVVQRSQQRKRQILLGALEPRQFAELLTIMHGMQTRVMNITRFRWMNIALWGPEWFRKVLSCSEKQFVAP